jgi:hypothetical protein
VTSLLRSRSLVATLVLGFAPMASACRSSEARQREAEAASLAHLVDQLRDAPNAAKAPLLERLRQASCESEDACALKSRCVSAYERHLAALTASERSKALLASDAGKEAGLLAAEELQKAVLDLQKAQALTESCASTQGELLRRVRAH